MANEVVETTFTVITDPSWSGVFVSLGGQKKETERGVAIFNLQAGGLTLTKIERFSKVSLQSPCPVFYSVKGVIDVCFIGTERKPEMTLPCRAKTASRDRNDFRFI